MAHDVRVLAAHGVRVLAAHGVRVLCYRSDERGMRECSVKISNSETERGQSASAESTHKEVN